MLKKINFFFIFALLISASYELTAKFEKAPFNKVIIWGHKLHSHTHSYVHFGFFKAFKHLGYDTYWLDNHDNVTNFDFSNSLFITEGQVDQKMPLRFDCRYILHNCEDEISCPLESPQSKYYELFNADCCIRLQVYTHKYLKNNVTKLDDYIYYNKQRKIIYMPWATDLLPDEIDENKRNLNTRQHNSAVYWVGTIWDGIFGNREKLDKFAHACQENNIQFIHNMHLNPEKNIEVIKKSYIAPAIQGKWQCDEGYIPCRIFKNISYGQWGVTNSKTVYELFNRKIVYNEDCYQLFYDAQKKLQTLTLEEQYELMDFVKEKHTYLNRIQYLLEFLNMIKPLVK